MTPQNETPLHLAAKQGHSNIVRLLVNHGADMFATDVNGYTPLDLAEQMAEGSTAAAAAMKVTYQNIVVFLWPRMKPIIAQAVHEAQPGAVPEHMRELFAEFATHKTEEE